MADQLAKYEERKKRMLDYLKLKLEEGDFHGVQDAASDIRDIEGEIKGYLAARSNITEYRPGICVTEIRT
jgi:hypothetical protein